MKFKIGCAIKYVFKDKHLLRKNFFISSLILTYLLFGILRSFCTSFLYFDELADKISLALLNFSPNSFFSFLGFPVVVPYTISFDIGQLALGGLDIFHLSAIGFVTLASLVACNIIGYFIYNTHNRIFYPEQTLAELSDFSNYFKKGLKFVLGCAILSLPILIINLVLYKVIYIYFGIMSSLNPDLSWFFQRLKPFSVYFCVVLGGVILFSYLNAAVIPFICNFKFKSFFKFKNTFKTIFKRAYFKYLGFLGLLNIVFACFIFLMNVVYMFGVEYFSYDFKLNIIDSETMSAFIVSVVCVVVMLPFVFWLLAIMSDISAQFINYTLSHAEDAQAKKIAQKKKKIKKRWYFYGILLIILVLGMYAIYYFK